MADEWSTIESNWQGVDDGEFEVTNNNIPTIGEVVKKYGRYIYNGNYRYALTDKYNKLVVAVKSNGDIEFGFGIPSQIYNYITEQIDNIKNGTSSIDVDGLNKIIAFLSEFTTEETLLKHLDRIYGNYVSNAYYYNAIVDKHKKLVEAIGKDGTKEFFSDVIFHGRINNINIPNDFYTKQQADAKFAPKESKPRIICWGDSLTAGAGGSDLNLWTGFCSTLTSMGFPDFSSLTSMNYVKMLSQLLKNDYRVLGCGVGGENIRTIASREGAELAYIPNDIILPQTAGQKVTIISGTNVSLPSQYYGYSSPLIQGNGNSVNPVYVEGIECELSADVSDYQVSAYYLTRVSDGGRNITIPAGTPIIMYGSKLHADESIAVLWCWQNGGYMDDNDLIIQLDNMIKHLGTTKYLIIGLHSGTAASRATQEALLEKTYGDKFFNWRRYVSSNAMYDFALTPTTEDENAMAVGSIPPSLLHDSVHLNAVGYSILGIKITERFDTLAYISINN